jgi:hypothetical protein
VRWILICAVFLLTGCGPGLVFNNSQEMTSEQMLQRADHIFIGVITDQQLQLWPFLRIPGQETSYWRVARRRVRIENVLVGSEARKEVHVFEYFWTGPASGDWNTTQNNDRDLFLVRVENGRYHIVRDWWRSIFKISSGKHDRLPLDDSHPFWERVGLLMVWVRPDWSPALGSFWRNDPWGSLGNWRMTKILRGLARHPNLKIRLLACGALLQETAQDECWNDLAPSDRASLTRNGIRPQDASGQDRNFETQAKQAWEQEWPENEIDRERLLTTVNNRPLREQFCRLFLKRFPNDHDNGCPADQPPPATIVTEDGDVPLTGPWPAGK